VRCRRPLQGLGYHRPSGPGGHGGNQIGTFFEPDVSVPLVIRDKNMLNKLTYTLSLSLLALAINTPAGAQQNSEPDPKAKQAEDDSSRTPDKKKDEGDEPAVVEEILVTGSLIPREANIGISPI